MPIPSAPDETPAWIKGDLPNKAPEVGDEPEDGSAAAPAHAAPPDPAASPGPTVPAIRQAPADLETAAIEIGELAAASGSETPRIELQTEAGSPALPLSDQSVVPERPKAETLPTRETFLPMPGVTKMAQVNAEKPSAVTEDPTSAPASSAPVPLEPVALEAPVLEALSLEAQIESLLFVADGAVPVGRLAEALEVPSREVESALTALGQSYRPRGLTLQRFRDKVQLTTSPSAAARVERFLGLAAASPLTRAALETLAIVAYQQPVTRPQIDAVRGVNSDSVIKNLLSKGLIEETGRAEGPGRPVLYATTPEFMQHFGLASLSDLPPLALPGVDRTVSPARILKG